MIRIFNQVRLDVARPNDGATVLAKQGDMNSRFMEVSICFNGCDIRIPEGANARLHVIRADGVGASFEGSITDGGRVILPIDRWITTVSGDSSCSVEVVYDDQVLSTMSFTLRTESSDDVNDLGDPDILPTDPEYDAVVAMLGDYKNGRLSNGAIYVRYSASPDGEDFSAEWTPERRYIGVAVSREAPTDKSGYVWSVFSGRDGRSIAEFRHIEDRYTYSLYRVVYTDGEYQEIRVPIGNGVNLNETIEYDQSTGLVAIPEGSRSIRLTGQCSGYMSGGSVYFVYVDKYNNIIYSTRIGNNDDTYMLDVFVDGEIPNDAVYFGTHTVSSGSYDDGDHYGYSCNLTAEFTIITRGRDGRGIVDIRAVQQFDDFTRYAIEFTDGTFKNFDVPKGQSYILTEVDKQEIAAIVAEMMGKKG